MRLFRWYRRQRLLAVRYHAIAEGRGRRAEWATWMLGRLDAGRT